MYFVPFSLFLVFSLLLSCLLDDFIFKSDEIPQAYKQESKFWCFSFSLDSHKVVLASLLLLPLYTLYFFFEKKEREENWSVMSEEIVAHKSWSFYGRKYNTTHIRIPTYTFYYIINTLACVCVCQYEINKKLFSLSFWALQFFFGTKQFFHWKSFFIQHFFYVRRSERERERGFEIFLNM